MNSGAADSPPPPMPTGGGGCSTSRKRSGCIRTSGRAPRQDTTVIFINKVILTVRLGWIFLQCLLASLGQQEASLTLYCGKNPAPNFRLLGWLGQIRNVPRFKAYWSILINWLIVCWNGNFYDQTLNIENLSWTMIKHSMATYNNFSRVKSMRFFFTFSI